MEVKLRMIYMALLVLSLSGGLKAQVKVGMPAPDFNLQDQFDKDFRMKDFSGQVVLLVYGDRGGSDYFDAWRNPVIEKYKSLTNAPLRIQSVANLNGIPEFMHAYVKKRFVEGSTKSNKSPISVLLDWHGEIARLFGFQEHLANIYLIDRSGIVRLVIAGKGTKEEVNVFLGVIDEVLQPTRGSARANPQPDNVSQQRSRTSGILQRVAAN